MKKRIFTVGIVVILLFAFYTTVFSNSQVEKAYVDIPEVDYRDGEIFVYGSIEKLDSENKEIIIEQHMDDNSIEINPILKTRDDAIIILQRNDKTMNVDFEDLKIGDRFGMILDKFHNVRGIIINA